MDMIMKPEQQTGLMAVALGVVMGIMSTQLGSDVIGTIVSIMAYVGLVVIFKRIFAQKKVKWIIGNSLLQFMLVWLVSWIIIFNMAGGF